MVWEVAIPARVLGPAPAAGLPLPVHVLVRRAGCRLQVAPLGTPDTDSPMWVDVGPVGSGGRESDHGPLAVAVHQAWAEATGE